MDGSSVVEVCGALVLSRQTFYVLQEKFSDAGSAGLLPKKPGPKGPTKLTARSAGFIRERAASDEEVSTDAHVRDRKEEVCRILPPKNNRKKQWRNSSQKKKQLIASASLNSSASSYQKIMRVIVMKLRTNFLQKTAKADGCSKYEERFLQSGFSRPVSVSAPGRSALVDRTSYFSNWEKWRFIRRHGAWCGRTAPENTRCARSSAFSAAPFARERKVHGDRRRNEGRIVRSCFDESAGERRGRSPAQVNALEVYAEQNGHVMKRAGMSAAMTVTAARCWRALN